MTIDFNTPANSSSYFDPMGEFRTFMIDVAGFAPDISIVPTDGDEVNRCAVADDKPGQKSGWYVYFNDKYPAGECGNWRTSERWIWTAKQVQGMTEKDRRRAQELIQTKREHRELALKKAHSEAADKALDLWSKAEPCDQYPYLKKKQIPSYGLKIYDGRLVVPVENCDTDLPFPFIASLQFIDAVGEKQFLSNGEIKGNYYAIPEYPEIDPDVIAIAEGYATAATVRLTTGWTVVIAFNAGNLLAVAMKWKKRYPNSKIIICADDDQWKSHNAGRICAERCVKELGVKALFPKFKDVSSKPTDWNDLYILEGMEEVRHQLLEGVKPSRKIKDWGLEVYSGKPEDRQWIVENTIPRGCAFIFAASGGSGKGMIMLDLALKVAGKFPAPKATNQIDFNPPITAFGNPVVARGSVVIISSEDDKNEIHRRIESLGIGEAKDLYVMPLPDTGGPMPLVVNGQKQPELSNDWIDLRKQLIEIKPVLVIFDPLSPFIMADINKDPVATSFTMSNFATLAKDTGASIILVHHVSKNTGFIKNIDQARNAIRGSGALVDGVRAAYSLWGMEDSESKAICRDLDVEWAQNKVMYGAPVRSNGPGDMSTKTWLRNSYGLLEVIEEQVRDVQREKIPHEKALMIDVIKQAAENGCPFTKSGTAGLYTRRNELPLELRNLGRNKTERVVQDLLNEKLILQCIAKGSNTPKWLDVPNGPFHKGEGVFAAGAAEASEDEIHETN